MAARQRQRRPIDPGASLDLCRSLQQRLEKAYKDRINCTRRKRMSVRFHVVLSDDLNREIDKAAQTAETNKRPMKRTPGLK